MYLRILKYIKPYYKRMIFAVFFALLFSVSSVYFMALVRNYVRAIMDKNQSLQLIYTLDIVGLYIVRLISSYYQNYLMSYISNRITINLRVEVYSHIQRLSLDFFEKYRQGDITSRLLGDISAIENVIRQTFTSLLTQSMTLIGVVGYLFVINWKLTLITFFVLPLSSFLIQKFGIRVRKISSKVRRKNADIFSVLQESLAAVRIVKAFTMENHEIKRFMRENERNFKFTMKNVKVTALQEPVLGLLQFLPTIFVIWYATRLVILDQLPVDKLFEYIAGLMLVIDPVIALSKVYTLIQGAFASSERVFQLLDIKATVSDKKGAHKLEDVTGKIEFKGVTFAYEEKAGNVLQNINVTINPGETVALVGASGAGKTTFVNLVPRFYDVQEGEILIDGYNVKDLDSYSYRSRIGIVPQETVLFSGAVDNNIAYGKMGASREEIIIAAKMANADEFISKMKNGYVTRVGERGQKLSGGQKQRIAIARAILKNPKILILDEATSALDNESEKLVQEAFERLMKDRTTIVIAHRLSTIINADRILVFDKGKVVEEGTHSSLLKEKGIYKKLYDLNFKDEN